MKYTASGAENGGGTLSRDGNLAASWNVVNCDTTPPQLSLPADVTAEATSSAGAVVTYTATASDANPTNPTVTCSKASGSTFALGTTTVNCSATDAAGNTGTGSFTVTVRDTTAPVIANTPTGASAEATSAAGAVVSYTNPTATDTVVEGSVSVVCDAAPGDTFEIGITTVTCTATDLAGNSDSETFTVTVQDTKAPEIDGNEDQVLEATGPSGAAAAFTVTASDLVDGTVSVDCNYATGDVFPLGDTTISCSATDAANNKATATFIITVRDTTAPEITVPAADITVEAAGPSGAPATYTASATDIVDGDVTPDCAPASGSTFALGTTTVTCSAEDAAGNSDSRSFNVIVEDTTAPAITVPSDITKEATGPNGAAATYSASASDLVDGSITADCVPPSGSTFALGTTSVTCSAEDAAGNSDSKSFNVIVQDTTPPALTVPANITAVGTGTSGAAVSYTASATDLVDGSVTPDCSPASGSTFAYGTTTVSCTATDNAGNRSAAETFTVTVTYTRSGFYTPVDMTTGASPVVNTVKGGSTVPLKFEVFAGSTEITNTNVVSYYRYKDIACNTLGAAAMDDIEQLTSGSTVLRYDTTGGQFIQNWQTPRTVGKCYVGTIGLTDGSTISAYFKTK